MSILHMNHLVDANYYLCLGSVQTFVEDVDKVSHLNIFMNFLRRDRAKIKAVCDEVVSTLKGWKPSRRYANAVLAFFDSSGTFRL